MTSDRITLTLPRDRRFASIAHLVVGGLAARRDVTLEGLEDLQLALDGLLEREKGGEITVEVRLEGDVLHAHVGPFRDERIRDELRAPGRDQLDLRRLLDALVDDVTVVGREDGDWVELTKSVSTDGEGS